MNASRGSSTEVLELSEVCAVYAAGASVWGEYAVTGNISSWREHLDHLDRALEYWLEQYAPQRGES